MPIPGMPALVKHSQSQFGVKPGSPSAAAPAPGGKVCPHCGKNPDVPPPGAQHPAAAPGMAAHAAPPGAHPAAGAPPGGQDPKAIAQAQAALVAAGKVDPQLQDLMGTFDPETDGVPDWATDENLWAQAESAVQPNSPASAHMPDPWTVVAMTYKALGGPIDASAANGAGGAVTPPVGTSPGAPPHHADPSAAPVSGM